VLLSIPTQSQILQGINLLINTLFLLAAIDFIVFPFFDIASTVVFTRVGAVYSDSVKIVIRYPQNNAPTHTVRVIWREFTDQMSNVWRDGPVLNLTEENDWVDTVRLGGLWPSTTYECELFVSAFRLENKGNRSCQINCRLQTGFPYHILRPPSNSTPFPIHTCLAAPIFASLCHHVSLRISPTFLSRDVESKASSCWRDTCSKPRKPEN
jgi:hypothetical protein